MVFDRDGAAYTNSQHVAAYFGKRHDNVLRDIDEIVAHSSDLRNVYFQQVSEDHPTVAGRKIRSFDLTKDGFTLLGVTKMTKAAVVGSTALAVPFRK